LIWQGGAEAPPKEAGFGIFRGRSCRTSPKCHENIVKNPGKLVITLLRVIPTLAFKVIYSDICFDILPNILSDICSDILSDISFNILFDIYFDILSGIF